CFSRFLKLARMASAEQVTERKLSAIGYQLSACSGAQTASSSLQRPLLKGADNHPDSRTSGHAQGRDDIRVLPPTRRRFVGIDQNLCPHSCSILPQYWLLSMTPIASSGSLTRTF